MALPDPMKAFVWGAGGTRKTPEQIARDREVAAALMKTGVDFSPIASPWQGLARVANAAAGAYGDYRADQAETANAATNQNLVQALLGGWSQQFPEAPDASGSVQSPSSDTTTPAVSPVAYTPLSDGADWLSYANQGATRNQPLSDKLTGALGSFLPEMGVTMKVFSGGQDAEGPRRTGSHRHDHGNAADVFFYKDGRQLSWDNPQDLPIFEDIVRRGRAAGVTGFGAGDGYMRPGSMHIGFGSPAVWGAGGRGSNAPDWLRTAFNSPEKAQASSALDAVNAMAGQPTQVASADPSIGLPQQAPVPEASPALPAPRTISDHPVANVAQALASPDLSRIPVTAGGNAGVYQPGQGNMQAIVQALSSPYADDQTKRIAGLLLGQQMERQQQASDPLRQLQIQKMQQDLTQGKLINAGNGFLYNPTTQEWITAPGANQEPDSIKALRIRAQEAGLQPGTPAYQQFMTQGGKGPLVTVNTGENSSKFVQKSDEAAAKRMDEIVQAGQTAPQTLADMQQLMDLGAQIGTGKAAQAKAIIGPYAQAMGINIDGMSDIQAYQAITSRLAPQMRAVGSGSSSDRDVALFFQSLPSLGNTAGGNEIIANTMKAVAQNKINAADIASKAQRGEISWQDADKQIRELPNPYDLFKQFQAQGKKVTTQDGYTIEEVQ